jgi:uncharacterized protein YeeX (DUF496 family)
MKIFDLEQEIMDAWHVVDDIDLLYENVIETDMSTDDIANVLLGLKGVYSMRFQKLFNTFEEVCKEYHAMRKENGTTRGIKINAVES